MLRLRADRELTLAAVQRHVHIQMIMMIMVLLRL